jgi:hypothetical protein
VRPKAAPEVETKAKSSALLPVSCGKPLNILRTKLYSPFSVGETGAMPLPSLNRASVRPKPAASSRFSAVRAVVVRKSAMPVLSAISAV